MSSKITPILSLRKTSTPSILLEKPVCIDDALDSLAVMATQDVAYKCRDYMGRRRKRCGHDAESGTKEQQHRDDSVSTACPIALDEMVDEVCREKMCEWSYRVCDHFHTSREIVSFAFSYLDRFIDRCSCDRTAFKLASMTALYMATKLLNAKQLSIHSLAELSRGEFEVSHIAEMERIILETLDWRMNPPTVQSYICLLRPLLESIGDAPAVNDIFDRAIFFAELSVYDYNFVTEERYLLTIACFLNAIEGMDKTNRIVDLKRNFHAVLDKNICLVLDNSAIEQAQARLWYLYSCSAQLQYDDLLTLQIAQERLVKYNVIQESDTVANSPVSVNVQGSL